MYKPVKENTVPVVRDRVTKTFGVIGTVMAPLCAQADFARARTWIQNDPYNDELRKQSALKGIAKNEANAAQELTGDIHEALIGFFRSYKINYPASTEDHKDAEQTLEGVLESNGQVALDAIEGLTRLVGKVTYFTYETTDPRQYVRGLLEVLNGFPLEQLRSTPNKPQAGFNERTFRDRISDLLSSGKHNAPYMLELLPEVLPQAAARIRPHGQAAYKKFVNQVLTYLNSLSSSEATKPTTMKSVAASLSSIAKGLMGPKRITPQELENLIATAPDQKTALELVLGGTIVAVGYSSHVSGVNRIVSLFVTANGQSPVKHSVQYGSSRASPQVIDALLRIQQKCSSSLRPSDALYQTNSAAGRNLPYIGGGQKTRLL
mgnify:CR=1 FL=1